jgi:hypothetical protein
MADQSKERLLHVDERFVGRHIDAVNMAGMMKAIMMSLSGSVPESEDEDPNVASE